MTQNAFADLFNHDLITARVFTYTTTVTNTYRWELEVAPDGLHYHDVDGEYHGVGNHVEHQTLEDYWKHGPAWPLPDRALREDVLALLRTAWSDPARAPAHFPLFDYPRLENTLQWTSGDRDSSVFTIVRGHGVDQGHQNWHDGLVWLRFFSFELFLTRPEYVQQQLGAEIWTAVVERLPEAAPRPPLPEPPTGAAIPTNTPTPVDAPANTVLTQPGPKRSWLARLADTIRLPGHAKRTTRAYIDRAAANSPRDRQEVAAALWKSQRSEHSVELLLGLLQETVHADYWKQYVFNQLFDMRESRSARQFVLACLRGDDETYFKKAVDVLLMWGLRGDGRLANPDLLAPLRWEERGTPAFARAVVAIERIID